MLLISAIKVRVGVTERVNFTHYYVGTYQPLYPFFVLLLCFEISYFILADSYDLFLLLFLPSFILATILITIFTIHFYSVLFIHVFLHLITINP